MGRSVWDPEARGSASAVIPSLNNRTSSRFRAIQRADGRGPMLLGFGTLALAVPVALRRKR